MGATGFTTLAVVVRSVLEAFLTRWLVSPSSRSSLVGQLRDTPEHLEQARVCAPTRSQNGTLVDTHNPEAVRFRKLWWHRLLVLLLGLLQSGTNQD